MPLQSREVVTLRLIFDCDEGEDEDGEEKEEEDHDDHTDQASTKSRARPSLLGLPVELRLKILRHLLRIDDNRESYTRRPPSGSIQDLLRLDPRHILEAPPFRHRGSQEINGSPPVIIRCPLYPDILMTCKKLHREGRTVLYAENKVVGIRSGIKGLGAKLRNYGIPAWGPLPPSRLKSSPGVVGRDHLDTISFDPVMLFSGQKRKRSTLVYICSYKDAADLVHALWILIKSSFARDMRFNLTLTADPRSRHIGSTDSYVKHAILPWLHNHIGSITFHNATTSDSGLAEHAATATEISTSRMAALQEKLSQHMAGNKAEPNVYSYHTICGYLEQVLLHAEKCIDMGQYLRAETLFERVCYEATSIVRTRTGKLVDVSSKTKDGINRVCKLIAVTAYRLCELRSGSLLLRTRSHTGTDKHGKSNSKVQNTSPITVSLDDNENGDDVATLPMTPMAAYDVDLRLAPMPASSSSPRMTRLDPDVARELALVSGLLALRLPCATPVPEWNIRLNIMLLRLFTEKGDYVNADRCFRRIETNCIGAVKEARAKNKSGPKWQNLERVTANLTRAIGLRLSWESYSKTVDRCEEVIAALWGPRLMPKNGYTGLIWTFRWA